MEVEWSEGKRSKNLRKHGIDFLDAARVFQDPNRIWGYDHTHSDEEDRWWTIGTTYGRLLFVVAMEWDDRVRMISARKASSDERRRYYESLAD